MDLLKFHHKWFGNGTTEYGVKDLEDSQLTAKKKKKSAKWCSLMDFTLVYSALKEEYTNTFWEWRELSACVHKCTHIQYLHVRFDMQVSQEACVKFLRRIQINQYGDLWHFCVKIPQVEDKSRGLWDAVMFTFRAHTQTSSSALVALRNTGYANFLSSTCAHAHTRTFRLMDSPCCCSAPKSWNLRA